MENNTTNRYVICESYDTASETLPESVLQLYNDYRVLNASNDEQAIRQAVKIQEEDDQLVYAKLGSYRFTQYRDEVPNYIDCVYQETDLGNDQFDYRKINY